MSSRVIFYIICPKCHKVHKGERPFPKIPIYTRTQKLMCKGCKNELTNSIIIHKSEQVVTSESTIGNTNYILTISTPL